MSLFTAKPQPTGAAGTPEDLSDRELAAVSVAGGVHSFIHLLGPAGLAFAAQASPTVEDALLLYAVSLMFAAGAVALTRDVPSSLSERRLMLNVALAGTLVAVGGTAALGSLEAAGTLVRLAFAALLGGSLGLTSKYQFDAFQAVRQARGERAHVLVIAGSGLTSGALFALCILSTLGVGCAGAVLAACTVASWAIYYRLAPKTLCPPCELAAQKAWKSPPKLLVESAARGLASAVALSLALYAGFGQAGSAGLLVFSAVGALAVPCLLVWYARSQRCAQDLEDLAYGHTLRLFVITLGAGFALLPLVKGSPALVCLTCFLMVQFNACLTPFNIANLCHSKGLPARVVVPHMYLANVTSGCVGALLVAVAHNLGGEALCYEAAALAGVLAALSFVPMLPTRHSAITVMVSGNLPEDERPEDRVLRVKNALVESKVLTAREAEVFELLVANRTRKEIAERLCISASTVKNHTTSVYEKLGVHAQHELVERVLRSSAEAGELG